MSKHVRMVDLYDNGVEFEVIVVQENKYNGDLYFIKTMDLDEIDMDRMRKLLRRRDAARLEVWDLLDTVTLNNGVNALTYFHQLVLLKTASGEIMKPDQRRRGARVMPRAQVLSSQHDDVQSVPAAVKQGKRAPKQDTE